MGKLFISEHPLIQHKMSMLRDKNTSTKEFRELVNEITKLLTYEATRELPVEDTTVETPVAEAQCKKITKDIVVVPILRAGLGMVDGFHDLIPSSKIGHIGLYRDPDTLTPVEYYCKVAKNLEESKVFLLDPMLATGKTAEAAIEFLKERGAKDVTMLCVIAAPEGVKTVQKAFDDVDVYTAAYDVKLNEKGYIVPGLGDAGDRIFGTK